MRKAIMWFRDDLRLRDNPALYKAMECDAVLPIFILDETERPLGGASRWWLHRSLELLKEKTGGALRCYKGQAEQILPMLIESEAVTDIFYNQSFQQRQMERDSAISTPCSSVNIHRFNGSLLWKPGEVTKHDGTPYRVFTPFYRQAQGVDVRLPLEYEIDDIAWDMTSSSVTESEIDALGLLDAPVPWYEDTLERRWQVGEKAAQKCLQTFIARGLKGYAQGRDVPSAPNVSRLSPYLRWGQISPHQIWHAVPPISDDAKKFRSELAWREFSYHLLHDNPDMVEVPLNPAFEHFPWIENDEYLQRWQRGQTGIPIIDAGMRELWQTGYMHNRVRMIVASFLVKNLLIDWKDGEAWFWDCLVDADSANNSASWQWVAGCGADAAPYFRVFNPVLQSKKFDGEAEYIKRYVPELTPLPAVHCHAPWETARKIQEYCGCVIGQDYPAPMVDLKLSRQRALEAYEQIKQR